MQTPILLVEMAKNNVPYTHLPFMKIQEVKKPVRREGTILFPCVCIFQQ